MTDIVTRLRNPPFGTETSERNLMTAAADDIERLRAQVNRVAPADAFALWWASQSRTDRNEHHDWFARIAFEAGQEAGAQPVREDVALLERAVGYAAGHVTGAKEALARVLAAQPVREGQEGKAEPVAWQWRMHDTVTGEPSEWRDGRHGMSEVYVRDWKIEERPLYASQPDPAAEIARLAKERDEALDREHNAHLAVKEERAIADRAESELAVIREALAFLAENTGRELSFDGKFFCEDDNPDLWVVTEVRGGRNDCEWTTLGSGTTPLEALQAALANTAHRGQEEKGNGSLR